MPRAINNVASKRRRKKIIKRCKGYFLKAKNVYTIAKNRWEKGQQYAYRDRKQKKREFRSLWIIRINAACRENNITYSKFIHGLKKSNILLNRKVLADLAMNNPEIFAKIVNRVKEVAFT